MTAPLPYGRHRIDVGKWQLDAGVRDSGLERRFDSIRPGCRVWPNRLLGDLRNVRDELNPGFASAVGTVGVAEAAA